MTSPPQRFRVEGLARRGRIAYVHVVGSAGHWQIYGSAGFRMQVGGRTVHDALRLAGRKLPFRPFAVRSEESNCDHEDMPNTAT